jgi:hydroxymethylpyrimidine/phosphomethylpyrimidine kinase
MEKRYVTGLTVAGSDSGGCAGIQADVKTFSALGVFGASVITAVTAQNTCGVRAVEILSAEIVGQQLEAVFEDFRIDAVKTGMLPSPAIVEKFAEMIDRYRPPVVIVDPVMVSTSGDLLVDGEMASSFRKWLYPRLSLLTPNLSEASLLSGVAIGGMEDIPRAGAVLLSQGCQAVLIKGGHLAAGSSTDTLFRRDLPPLAFPAPRIVTENLHGTGCTLSAAIAAWMAQGLPLEAAVGQGKAYISAAILQGSAVTTGHGKGPVNHFFDPQPLLPIPTFP